MAQTALPCLGPGGPRALGGVGVGLAHRLRGSAEDQPGGVGQEPDPRLCPAPGADGGVRAVPGQFGARVSAARGPLRPRPITARPGLPQRPAANRGPARSPPPRRVLCSRSPRPPRPPGSRAPGSGLATSGPSGPSSMHVPVYAVCACVCVPGPPCLPQGHSGSGHRLTRMPLDGLAKAPEKLFRETGLGPWAGGSE